jgi:GNAT superfamily N-acetyltransferase
VNQAIRQAKPYEAALVSDILGEAARWLDQRGMRLWRDDELLPSAIASDVAAGLFFLAECGGEAAGTVRYQLEDQLFWPDIPQEQSAFVHRLAVRRRYAGSGVSGAILHWAVDRTRSLGRRYLRLDCDASRPRLRAVYEQFGFQYHSDRQVGPYLVARYEYDVAEARPEVS